jgi:hypothetical protein
MFILCTNGDGRYWRSGLEPLLYPAGCSFYRPFSYQEQWVHGSFLNVLKGDRRTLEAEFSKETWKTGILGLRFKTTGFVDTFIPLRKITLTKLPTVEDKVHLRFKFGEYVQLTAQRALHRIALSTVFNPTLPEDILLAEIPEANSNIFTSLPFQTDFPAGLWEKFATDASLPEAARLKFKGTTVLRLIKVSDSETGASLEPKNLQPEIPSSTEYGYELWKNKRYDLTLSYNRIYAPEESQEPLINDYQFSSRTDLYEVSKIRLPITGNYREENVWVMPKAGQLGTTFLEWIGTRKTDIGLIAAGEDKIIGIQVPVKNLEPAWPAARIRDSIIGAVLLVITVVLFWMAINLSAQVQSEDINHSQTITVLVALGGGCLTWGSIFLNDAIKGKY